MAASSGAEDDDPMQDTRAYGYSIYLMVAVPYLLLGGFGYFMYRGFKATQRANEALEQDANEAMPDFRAEEHPGT